MLVSRIKNTGNEQIGAEDWDCCTNINLTTICGVYRAKKKWEEVSLEISHNGCQMLKMKNLALLEVLVLIY